MITNGVHINIVLIFFIVGVVVGVFYNVLYIFKILTKNNLLVINVLEFLYVFICGFLFLIMVFLVKNGELSFFELLLYVLGIVFGQIIVKNLFTSPIKWVYNKFKFKRNKLNVSLD